MNAQTKLRSEHTQSSPTHEDGRTCGVHILKWLYLFTHKPAGILSGPSRSVVDIDKLWLSRVALATSINYAPSRVRSECPATTPLRPSLYPKERRIELEIFPGDRSRTILNGLPNLYEKAMTNHPGSINSRLVFLRRGKWEPRTCGKLIPNRDVVSRPQPAFPLGCQG